MTDRDFAKEISEIKKKIELARHTQAKAAAEAEAARTALDAARERLQAAHGVTTIEAAQALKASLEAALVEAVAAVQERLATL